MCVLRERRSFNDHKLRLTIFMTMINQASENFKDECVDSERAWSARVTD